MNDFNQILNTFDPISLSALDKVRLMDRMDVKYVFNINQLPEMLSLLSPNYYMLVTGGSGLNEYENHYFDTAEHQMYIHHHNGKLNRYKIRFRTYKNTGDTFFEIKFKSNKGRTVKTRVPVSGNYSIHSADESLLKQTGYIASKLHESIKIDYTRITLVSKSSLERVTIDINLHYCSGKEKTEFPKLVIAEVKQPKLAASLFNSLMQEYHIKPFNISKYCLGIASIKPSLKTNNLKYKINHVNKLCQSPS